MSMRFLTAFLLVLALTIMILLPGPGQGAPGQSKGAELIKKGQYAEAVDFYLKERDRSPGDAQANYYLGLSYIYAGKPEESEDPLSRVVVGSTGGATAHGAASLLYRYRRIRPYSCVQDSLRPPGLIRWNRKTMPLQIYVSDGRMLPGVFDDLELSPGEHVQVGKWSRNPSFMARLAVSPLYKPIHRQTVMSGYRAWDWAKSEDLIDYAFTGDPTKADLLVFWCNKLRRYDGVTYHPPLPKGKNYPTVMFINLRKSQGPTAASYQDIIREVAAHEMGHVLGLLHSPNKEDLMYPEGKGKLAISSGDRTTLRALYHMPADVLLAPVPR
ncbi:MAG: matrixin family metalloprotease [Cyanobacteria bacterium HKST-UBA02]|nr:matrixin family metalloprotease [Cyanobacteria bacterium HKST-UBA02]